MPATRLSSAGRRASIIAAARAVFARHGLEGARTQQIARAAGVSEALLFRHFPTKTHLYRAVLREVIIDQNRVMRSFGEAEASTEGLLEILRRTFSYAMAGMHAINAEGLRMVVGIAGETLSITNAGAFVEHISTIMMMARCHDKVAIPYDEDRALHDAILFCARGLGVEEARIQRFLKQMNPTEPGDSLFVKRPMEIASSDAG